MSGKKLFDATQYIGADLIHRAEFAKLPKSHWKQVLSTAAVFAVLLGAGIAALHNSDTPAPIAPTPPSVSEPQTPAEPAEPETPLPKLITDEAHGVTMAVPEPLQELLAVSSPFSFTLQRTSAEPTQENRLWFLEITARNEGQSPDECYNWGIWKEDFKLGWDDTCFYVLHVPPLTEAAEENRTSLLLAFPMLQDFLERNGITPNPNWETAYLRHIPNFWTQAFDGSLIDTTQADESLQSCSHQIPNLGYYVWNNPTPILTWEDLLVYRMATADFSQVTDNPEGLRQFIFTHMLPYSEDGYDGGNPEIPDEFRMTLEQLHRQHQWIRRQENLPELCMKTNWRMDQEWTMHCGDAAFRIPAHFRYRCPDGRMVRDNMDIVSASVAFIPVSETGPMYHEVQISMSNRQIQQMKTLFDNAELTTVLQQGELELPTGRSGFDFYIRYADGGESGFWTENVDSGIFYRYIIGSGSGPDVETGYIRAVNPALIPWMKDLLQQTSRESH